MLPTVLISNKTTCRYNNHKLSFKHRKYSHDTVMSKDIWDLKDNYYTDFSIKWSIVMQASSYKH